MVKRSTNSSGWLIVRIGVTVIAGALWATNAWGATIAVTSTSMVEKANDGRHAV